MYNTQPNAYAPAVRSASGALTYLRRVYALFGGGIAFVVAGALIALYAGEPVVLGAGSRAIQVSPVVAFGLQHQFLAMIGFIGAFFAASALRRTPGINAAALFGFTFVSGLFIAPALFLAQLSASQGGTLSASPVRDAFLLTAAAFTGLTSYVFITKKDFSFLGAALSTGIWVVLGASLLAMFLGSSVFNLAIASVGVLLFAGYVLYDTSRIMKSQEGDDAVGAALSLFLDVFNMFLYLLRILSSRRN